MLLTADTERYEAYLQYRLSLSQRFTGVPGRLRMSLVFLDTERGVVLKVGEAVVLVGEKKDVVDDMPDGTLDTLSGFELRLSDIEASVSMAWSEL